MYSANSSEQELIAKHLEALAVKYDASGQSLPSYLEGLLHANYLTYWNYAQIDTLLTLQNPRTDFPDEMIFVLYHQITELYFKAIIWEMEQLIHQEEPNDPIFLMKLGRITRYMKHLVHSFDVMVDGMEPAQFLKYRMSLMPASGFQSFQFRKIEILATSFHHLLGNEHKDKFNAESNVSDIYEHIYWRRGATELATGKKTLTLKQFEERYSQAFLSIAAEVKDRNLYALFQKHYATSTLKDKIVQELKDFDALLNIDWCLSHYKSAVRYLAREAQPVNATGGTNWQQYLPPRFQRIIFYPELWSEAEKAEWGKSWVVANVGQRTTKNG